MPYRTSCLHCLQPDAAELRVDRKGRPYTHCPFCMTRTFMHTAAGMRGIRLLAPKLILIYQEHYASLSTEDRHAAELLQSLQRERFAVVRGG